MGNASRAFFAFVWVVVASGPSLAQEPLTHDALSQPLSLTNPTTASGGGGGGCSQATAYLARTTGGNEGGNAANITTLICGLVTDGVWAKLDVLYVLAQQNQTDALLNLCGTTYGATAVGTGGTFTAYQGFSGFSNLNYLNTGFNPSTAPAPKFTQNSANFGLWVYADVSESVTAFGNSALGAAGESHIYNDFPGNLFYARVNSPNAGSVANPGTEGLYVGERTSSSTIVPYWGGSSQGSVTDTSQPPASGPFYIGDIGGSTTPSLETVSEAHIGASLGSAGQLALYTRLRTYMTAVGVP